MRRSSNESVSNLAHGLKSKTAHDAVLGFQDYILDMQIAENPHLSDAARTTLLKRNNDGQASSLGIVTSLARTCRTNAHILQIMDSYPIKMHPTMVYGALFEGGAHGCSTENAKKLVDSESFRSFDAKAWLKNYNPRTSYPRSIDGALAVVARYENGNFLLQALSIAKRFPTTKAVKALQSLPYDVFEMDTLGNSSLDAIIDFRPDLLTDALFTIPGGLGALAKTRHPLSHQLSAKLMARMLKVGTEQLKICLLGNFSQNPNTPLDLAEQATQALEKIGRSYGSAYLIAIRESMNRRHSVGPVTQSWDTVTDPDLVEEIISFVRWAKYQSYPTIGAWVAANSNMPAAPYNLVKINLDDAMGNISPEVTDRSGLYTLKTSEVGTSYSLNVDVVNRVLGPELDRLGPSAWHLYLSMLDGWESNAGALLDAVESILK